MIKNAEELRERPVEIDLSGPDGNAFALLGMAKKWGKQLGLDWKEIQSQMMSGEYDNLLDVMEEEFGDYVIFYR